MSILREAMDSLFPRKNRVVAVVAGVRTFEQSVRSNLTVGGTGAIVVTASDLIAVDWSMVLWVAIALLLSALIAAYIAFADVARHGVSSKYAEALAEQAALEAAAPPATVTASPATARVSPFADVAQAAPAGDPNVV